MRIRFGDCLLDTGRRELLCGGEPVHLPPKTFRLLEVLLENRPRAVSKAALIEQVWPGTFISESNLSSHIADLRTAIGDAPRAPRFLRTLHGFGYAFCGEAHEESGERPARWFHRLVLEGREIALQEGDNLLGRDPEAVAWIDHPSVSRRHARVTIAGETARIEDLGSKNGTWLRGERIASAVLSTGEEIRIGSVDVIYRVFMTPDSTLTSTAFAAR